VSRGIPVGNHCSRVQDKVEEIAARGLSLSFIFDENVLLSSSLGLYTVDQKAEKKLPTD